MARVNPPARDYAGETGDERAARRREALLDAAFDRAAQEGWPALRIDALCRAAGLHKRYFYEAFPDGLGGVAGAVLRRLADDAIAVAVAGIESLGADRTPAAATRASIGALVVHLTDDPRRARVLFGGVAGDADVARLQRDAMRRVVAAAVERGQSIHGLEANALVAVAASTLVGGTSLAVLDWLDGEVRAPREELVDHIVATWEILGDGLAARLRG